MKNSNMSDIETYQTNNLRQLINNTFQYFPSFVVVIVQFVYLMTDNIDNPFIEILSVFFITKLNWVQLYALKYLFSINLCTLIKMKNDMAFGRKITFFLQYFDRKKGVWSFKGALYVHRFCSLR